MIPELPPIDLEGLWYVVCARGLILLGITFIGLYIAFCVSKMRK